MLAYRVEMLFDGNYLFYPKVYSDPDWMISWGWTEGAILIHVFFKLK